MDLEIINLENKNVGKHSIDIDSDKEINKFAISQVVKWQLAKKRSGTASTKNRAMVKASGKKPFKQKGTGNARAGTRTSPIWRGGGVIFGPSPKDWSFSVPKKIKKLALNNALVYKLNEKNVHLIDSFELKDSKTKNLSNKLKNMNLGKKILIVNKEENTNLELSSRNLLNVKVVSPEGLNVYDLLNSNSILIHKDSIDTILARTK
ncbi:50S ribosomal protein L4 [bacterium]|nr:50S ribosomal protein L4 [bacterium]|tara:strand:- start:160 stop:777 length:618 start_codon:yes stop_codon:yes gene_type:complete